MTLTIITLSFVTGAFFGGVYGFWRGYKVSSRLQHWGADIDE